MSHVLAPSSKAIRLLFGATIFLGSFLLFQIQPIMGKLLLPLFGGSSSVWTVSMMFFMVVLLVGYGYAHVIVKWTPRVQIWVHSVLLIGAFALLAFIGYGMAMGVSPMTSFGTLVAIDSASPTLAVLTILGLIIGLPYGVLATTSSLLQRWFSDIHQGESPYKLYALSNLGGVLALVSYPFLIEPFLHTSMQHIAWGVLYVIYIVGMFGAMVLLRRCSARGSHKVVNTEIVAQHDAQPKSSRPSWRRYGMWVGLATLASVMLLVTTAQITQGIAAVPFLWLLPLVLYLLSFILTFSSAKMYTRSLYGIALLLSVFAALLVLFTATVPWVYVAAQMVLLFSCAMVCHGEIYRRRPHPKYLTGMYLMVSLGGALGGILVGIVAPQVFSGYWEYHIALAVSFFLALFVLLYQPGKNFLQETLYFKTRKRRVGLSILLSFTLIIAVLHVQLFLSDAIVTTRNFYGVLRVRERLSAHGAARTLHHGVILHGKQFMSDELRRTPTSYYGEGSGVQLILDHHPKQAQGEPMRVGVIGLGVGTLAAYCEPESYYRFYEIDSDVVRIAQEYFTYLSDCPGVVDIVTGDARIMLERELDSNAAQSFDVLAIDAFSDDAIPVHLLTKEALEIYLPHVEQENGVIAFHISNRNLDLYPVLLAAAQEFDLAITKIGFEKQDEFVFPSAWVLLAKNPEAIAAPEIQDAAVDVAQYSPVRLWTDSFSNLIRLLRIN